MPKVNQLKKQTKNKIVKTQKSMNKLRGLCMSIWSLKSRCMRMSKVTHELNTLGDSSTCPN